MREKLELSLNTELEADSFKKALDDSAGRKSLKGMISAWYYGNRGVRRIAGIGVINDYDNFSIILKYTQSISLVYCSN